MRAFILIPLAVCVYEMVSLILPLKLPLWGRIFSYLILLSGLAKFFLYRPGSNGFDIIALPYGLSLLVAVIFNFIIVAFFILVAKDFIFVLWKIFSRLNAGGAPAFPHYYLFARRFTELTRA